jgi:hypothetical protein
MRTELVHEVIPRSSPAKTTERDQDCIDFIIQETQVRFAVHHRVERNEIESSEICLGV